MKLAEISHYKDSTPAIEKGFARLFQRTLHKLVAFCFLAEVLFF